MAKTKTRVRGKVALKTELLKQLKSLNKDTAYNRDLIDSYIYQFELKDKLQKDIDDQGIRISTVSGNGFEMIKPNESVERLKKTNELMLNILVKLGLDVALVESDEDVYS